MALWVILVDKLLASTSLVEHRATALVRLTSARHHATLAPTQSPDIWGSESRFNTMSCIRRSFTVSSLKSNVLHVVTGELN